MTKKDFVLAVSEEIQKQPKVALTGHGINGQMLSVIANRPDIIAKLVQFISNTKNWKKGKNALKKTKDFKITAYKNFNDFNKRGDNDVAKFVESLDDKDKETFDKNGNVTAILCLTEKVVDELDLANEIANGKSQFIPYDKAVTSQYKLPSGFYITIAFTSSVILTKAQNLADRTNAKNAKTVERNTKIAKVKSEFVKKNKAKLANLKKEVSALESSKQIAVNTQQDLASSLQQLGISSGKVADIKAGKLAHDNRIKEELLKLTDRDNANLQQARQLWRNGFEKEALTVALRIKEGDKNVITDYIKNDGLIDAKSKIKAKKEAIQNNVKNVEKDIKEARKAVKKEETPLAKKKAQAEVERLKRVKEIELKKLENAKRLEENKSLNIKSSVNSITERINKLTSEGSSLQEATEKAVNEIEDLEATKAELIAKINRGYEQQLVQQNITDIQQITPAIAQQILQQVVTESLSGGRKKTPLMIKKELAEKAVTNQQVATEIPVTVGGVSTDVVEKIDGNVITTAKSDVGNVVNDVNEKTPLMIKKEQAEKEKLARQIIRNQESKMQDYDGKSLSEKMAIASEKVAKQMVENPALDLPSDRAMDRAKKRAESFQDNLKSDITEAIEQPAQKFEMDLMGDGDLRAKVMKFI